MANNFTGKNASGDSITFKSTDTASVHTGHVNVDNLPADPATSAKQDTGNTSLASILAALSDPSTATLQTAGNTSLSTIASLLAAALTVNLPTGAATSAKQDTGNTSLASIASALASALTINLPADAATATLQGTGNTSLAAIASALAGALTINLPTGAATATLQGTANTALSNIQTAVETLDNAIAGSEMQTDIVSITQPGTMFTEQHSVATGTATALNGGTTKVPASVVTLFAPSTNTVNVFVGPSGVTVSNGRAIEPGHEVVVEINDLAKIFAIAGSASQVLHVICPTA